MPIESPVLPIKEEPSQEENKEEDEQVIEI